MHTAQRGSVLLTIIGGIVILALLGMIAVSLMTNSVMTGVDAKETVQASYLAESGKEIVRAQTAQITDGAVLMQTAEKLSGSPIPMKQTGDITLTIYPYWFNTEGTKGNDHKLVPAAAEWYGKGNAIIAGTVDMLLMNASETIRAVYQFKGGTGTAEKKDSLPSSAYAANAYLIGRCAKLALSGDTLTATPTALSDTEKEDASATTDSFAFFPPTGGLLGLVEKRPEGNTGNLTTKLATIRFTYTNMSRSSDGRYTFSGISPLDGASLARLDEILRQTGGNGKEKWDVALGQYFRVVSEGRTANGARAALVWHTNGRSSFVQKSGGSDGNGEISKDENVSSDLKDTGSAHSTLDIAGTIQNATSEGVNGGITVQGFPQQGSNPNHFMRTNPPAFSTLDYWFSGISKERIDLKENKDVWVQTSFKAWTGTEECFAGILFRTSFLPISKERNAKPDNEEDASSLNKNYGVSGLGLSIARGALRTHYSNIGDGVGAAPANPALFPGFTLTNDISNFFNLRLFKPLTISSYSNLYTQIGTDFELSKPLAILWAYDDEKEPLAFHWLAVGIVDNKMLYTQSIHYPTVTSFYTTLAARVWEEKGSDGKNVNKIRGWVTSQYNKPYDVDTITWPSLDASQNPTGFQPIKWLYVNTSRAQRGEDDFTLVTKNALATEDVHNRAGIVNGAYGQVASTRNLIFRNFAVGTASGEGGGEVSPGLTPGIVQ